MRARLDGRQAAAVFAGGTAGVLVRAVAEELLPASPGHWPWATLAVNLVGALILGFVAVTLSRRPYARSLTGTGFCGALTTFSTFSLEAFQIADHGRAGLAVAYVALSLGLGLGAAAAGIAVGRRVVGQATP